MEVIALTTYVDWLAGLKNRKDALRISARVLRIEQNNFGDCKSVGDGVSELRFTFGPGCLLHPPRRNSLHIARRRHETKAIKGHCDC